MNKANALRVLDDLLLAASPADLVSAREAVAELIEAASAGHEMQAHGGGTALYFNVDKADRLRAALARCRGGAA